MPKPGSWLPRNTRTATLIQPKKSADPSRRAGSLGLAECDFLEVANGEHPKIVQERLGHSSIALTLDTYSHVVPAMQEQAATRLDNMLEARDNTRSEKQAAGAFAGAGIQ